MNKNKKSGFTLIELLVVIAIIGILSSIVLVSLGAARAKGQDTKTKAQLNNAQNAAQLFFDANNNYIGLGADVIDGNCATIDSMFVDVDSGMAQYTDLNNYPNPLITTMRCTSTNSSYVMSVSLSDPNEFWCVDWTGTSKSVNAASHILAHPDGAPNCP